MSDVQENTTAIRSLLLEDGNTVGKEIDSFIERASGGQDVILGADKLAITVVAQVGDTIATHCVKVLRDENGIPEIMALSTEFQEPEPSTAADLFDRLAGGLWSWPVVEEGENG